MCRRSRHRPGNVVSTCEDPPSSCDPGYHKKPRTMTESLGGEGIGDPGPCLFCRRRGLTSAVWVARAEPERRAGGNRPTNANAAGFHRPYDSIPCSAATECKARLDLQ